MRVRLIVFGLITVLTITIITATFLGVGALDARSSTESDAVHPTTEADLKMLQEYRPTIVGIRARWCVSQDACR